MNNFDLMDKFAKARLDLWSIKKYFWNTPEIPGPELCAEYKALMLDYDILLRAVTDRNKAQLVRNEGLEYSVGDTVEIDGESEHIAIVDHSSDQPYGVYYQTENPSRHSRIGVYFDLSRFEFHRYYGDHITNITWYSEEEISGYSC